MPKRLQKQVKLHNDCVDEESVGKCRPRMVLDKGHEESKTNKHHDIDVLVHGVVIGIVGSISMYFRSDKKSVHDDDDNLDNKEQNSKDLSVLLMRTHFGVYKFYYGVT